MLHTITPVRVPTQWKVRQPHSGMARIPFVQRCEVHAANGTQSGLICDLSASGLYVRLDPAPPVGARVHVTFQLFPGDALPVVAEAEVMWHNVPPGARVRSLPAGCGLRFVEMTGADDERIAGLVKAYTTPLQFPA